MMSSNQLGTVSIVSLRLSQLLLTRGNLGGSSNKVVTIGAPVGTHAATFTTVPIFHVTEDSLKLWTIPWFATRANYLLRNFDKVMSKCWVIDNIVFELRF